MALFTITWQISVVDVAGYSTWSSLAFHPGGQASVAYHSSINHQLRLAVQNPDGTWAPQVVDTSFGDSFPWLRYRGAQPGISYGSVTYPGGDTSHPLYQMKFAIFQGTLPWTIETLAPGWGDSSIAFTGQQATVAFIADHKLQFSRRQGGGTWVGQTVDTDKIGSFCALAFDPAGNPTIAYHYSGTSNSSDDLIKFARFNGSSWSHEDIGEGAGWISHAYSPAGEPAVVYSLWVGTFRAVMYGVFQAGQWDKKVVALFADSGYLAFAPSGAPAISFHDTNAAAVKYAILIDNGWRYSVVEKTGTDATGNFVGDFTLTSLAFNPVTGQPAISYYDRNNGTIRYAIGTVSNKLSDFLINWVRNVVAWR